MVVCPFPFLVRPKLKQSSREVRNAERSSIDARNSFVALSATDFLLTVAATPIDRLPTVALVDWAKARPPDRASMTEPIRSRSFCSPVTRATPSHRLSDGLAEMRSLRAKAC
jgi:hypothetical protein